MLLFSKQSFNQNQACIKYFNIVNKFEFMSCVFSFDEKQQ